MEDSFDQICDWRHSFCKIGRKFVSQKMEFCLNPQILLYDEGYFLFQFESDENCDRVMHAGPYTYHNK